MASLCCCTTPGGGSQLLPENTACFKTASPARHCRLCASYHSPRQSHHLLSHPRPYMLQVQEHGTALGQEVCRT